MLHSVSLIHVDNSAIQSAIANNSHPDTIASLKGHVAFNCVYGFEHHSVEFKDLGALLCHDVGFNMFKFKDYTTATYNKEKHPNAFGLVRGVNNIVSPCTWLCFDVDVTTITDTEMHKILSSLNHHIARTSDPSKATKYRVIVELSEPVTVTRTEWKHFIQSIATSIGIGKIDRLPMSQVFYGYENRSVMSQVLGNTIDPSTHLNVARTKVAEQEELDAVYSNGTTDKQYALDHPFQTFNFAYEAQVGDRWSTSMAAIETAKKLGASKAYIKDLMYAINDYLDVPKTKQLVESSLFSAI